MSYNTAKRHIGQRASRALSNTLIHILLVMMSIIWLIPFVCILLQSFRVENTWWTEEGGHTSEHWFK